jgi:hypothetical protein
VGKPLELLNVVVMKGERCMSSPSTRIIDYNLWQFGNVRRASDLVIISKTVRKKKGTKRKMDASFFSTTFVRNIFRSDKYLVSYARYALRNIRRP